MTHAGCIFNIACNYDPKIIDDGSCIFLCLGCTDPIACNYDAGAIQEMALAPTRRILLARLHGTTLLMPLVYAEVIAKMMRTRMDW